MGIIFGNYLCFLSHIFKNTRLTNMARNNNRNRNLNKKKSVKHSRSHARKVKHDRQMPSPSGGAFAAYRRILRQRMDGGGFSMDVGAPAIGGKSAEVVGYARGSEPAIIGGQLMTGSKCTGGGGKTRTKPRRHHRHTKRDKTGKMSKRNKKHRKTRRHIGGAIPGDAATGDFGCKQPTWGPNCV